MYIYGILYSEQGNYKVHTASNLHGIGLDGKWFHQGGDPSLIYTMNGEILE